MDVHIDDDTLFSDYLRTASQSTVDVGLAQERAGNEAPPTASQSVGDASA